MAGVCIDTCDQRVYFIYIDYVVLFISVSRVRDQRRYSNLTSCCRDLYAAIYFFLFCKCSLFDEEKSETARLRADVFSECERRTRVYRTTLKKNARFRAPDGIREPARHLGPTPTRPAQIWPYACACRRPGPLGTVALRTCVGL